MQDFETLTVEALCGQLKTDAERGLSEQEAAARLARDGENKLQEQKKRSLLAIFFSQLHDPMIYVLFAAIVVTAGISVYDTVLWLRAGNAFDFLRSGDWADVVIIFAVILLNAVIGTVQECKAASSLEALKQLSGPESTVIRGGCRVRVRSESLVVGDVVLLEEGDTIGADIRLTESVHLKVNESSLTGESLQVEKDADWLSQAPVGIADRKNMVYSSTPVTYGRGRGIVCRCGMQTEIGRIASALDTADSEPTPLQRTLAKLSASLGKLTLGVVILVLAVNLLWLFAAGNVAVASCVEAVLAAISLAVAAIPEGLPAVVTIVLALGVRKMVHANTVVRKLPSVETLGAVSVVCSDKTGTLTQNRMTVVEAYCDGAVTLCEQFGKETPSEGMRLLARGMTLCCNATVDEGVTGDPTEVALVRFANAFGLHKAAAEAEMPRIGEFPFDSDRKRMSTLHRTEQGTVCFTKGAPDSVLQCCTSIREQGQTRPMTAEDCERILQANSAFSERALRVLALAYRCEEDTEEAEMTFVGLVAMIDPERPEAAEAVKKLARAGIRTVMITGDHKVTAFAIAKKLGICTHAEQCFTGADVDAMTEQQLRECCRDARVFARVSPENKVQIVQAFRANGHICAMTGDGVNDAPSLKSADIGISMGITGTDVAKGAADMVLTDDNFASIEKAVEEGRTIYANIKKTVCFLLSSNIAEVLAMFLLICFGFPAPLIAIHLLWVNLITDSLPAIALGVDPKTDDILDAPPRDSRESIFAGGYLRAIIGYGITLTAAVLLAYCGAGWMNGARSLAELKALLTGREAVLAQARTMAFCTLAFGELVHMLNMSEVKQSVYHVFGKKNRIMALAFVLGVSLQLAVTQISAVGAVFSTVALSGRSWLWVLGCALLPLVVHEFAAFVRCLSGKHPEKARRSFR